MSKLTQVKAQPITDQTWILTSQTQRLGVLSVNSDQHWQFLGQGQIEKFTQLHELEAAQFWKITFEKKATAEEVVVEKIGHLPIKHAAPENIETDPVVSYTKAKTSAVRFAAGFWGLKFNVWQGSFCPKLQTLQEHEHVGPFSTKLELNTILAKMNAPPNKIKIVSGVNTAKDVLT